MLLRLLLKLIKPTNEQLRKSSCGKFTEFKIRIYQSALKKLLKAYTHYAISDTVTIGNRNIKIVHEYRDLEFENELIRNRIKFKPGLETATMPSVTRKSSVKRHFGYFRFKDLLSIYVGDKELFVKHDDTHSIDGTVKGRIRCSCDSSCTAQSVIDILLAEKVERTQPMPRAVVRPRKVEETSDFPASTAKEKPRQPQGNATRSIFGRENEKAPAPRKQAARKPVTEKPAQPEATEIKPPVIEKRGFDIDASF